MELASRELAVINLQVLNELCHVALRKLTRLSIGDVRDWVGKLRALGDAPLDAETSEAAWPIRAALGYSWFDCLLLASADRLGCTHFLSEDLGHGVHVGPLTIIDPFKAQPGELQPQH